MIIPVHSLIRDYPHDDVDLERLISLLKGIPVRTMIMGGFPARLIAGRKVSEGDIDMFTTSPENFCEVTDYFAQRPEKFKNPGHLWYQWRNGIQPPHNWYTEEYVDPEFLDYVRDSQGLPIKGDDGEYLQIPNENPLGVKFQNVAASFGSVKELMDSADFRSASAVYLPQDNIIMLSKEAHDDILKNRIHIQNPDKLTPERVKKYRDHGFGVSFQIRKELLKLKIKSLFRR